MEIIEQEHGISMDEGHLGGWALDGDGGTYYPNMWKYIVDTYNIKSVLDIGCGRGYSSRFFKSLGCTVKGIDGSVAAKELTLLEENEFVSHDYTKGFSNIQENFDFGWSCEFVEHVEEQYINNFLNDFSKCKYLAITFAEIGQTGHHHVNENTMEYWIEKIENSGFSFLNEETQILRSQSNIDKDERNKIPNVPFFISHFTERGLFFVNNNI